MFCYTDSKDETVAPRTPYGGGFGLEVYNLKYLYEEYKLHNNIWTKTNIYKDLCRYLYCKITVYRHPQVDFILGYDRQPPFNLNKLTYPSTHPHQMLQHKHKKILLSTRTNPRGIIKKRFYIKPPKQMLSKWFFSSAFCKYSLFQLRGTVADLATSYIGQTAENQQLGIYYLNQAFYDHADWGAAKSTAYHPYTTAPTTSNLSFTYKIGNSEEKTGVIKQDNYDNSVSYKDGWFQTALLKATALKIGSQSQYQATLPVNQTLYNPNLDTGEDTVIYVTSIQTTTYDPPTRDTELTIPGLPLWLGLYGYLNYIIETKKTKEYLRTHCVMLKSPAFVPYSQIGITKALLVLDKSFIEGKSAYDQPPTFHDKAYWYPTIEHQINTLEAIVECGPYIPKLFKQLYSTWELKYTYNFCFKWGGPLITDAEVTNPEKQPVYDVPDTFQQRIQIQNPEKITTESLIHNWDIRRGFIKEAALKRMCSNISIDTAFQADADYQPQKKKKRYLPKINQQEEENQELLNCLHSLCEESSCQDPKEETDLQILIQQQREYQHKLKRNILQLLADMKHKQRMLQLQTGLLE